MRTLASFLVLAACSGTSKVDTKPAPPPTGGDPVAKPDPTPGPTGDDALIAEAKKFLVDTDKELRRLTVISAKADWANVTDITPAHEDASAKAGAELAKFLTKAIKAAKKYEPIRAKLDAAEQRQLQLLPFGGQPAPTIRRRRTSSRRSAPRCNRSTARVRRA